MFLFLYNCNIFNNQFYHQNVYLLINKNDKNNWFKSYYIKIVTFFYIMSHIRNTYSGYSVPKFKFFQGDMSFRRNVSKSKIEFVNYENLEFQIFTLDILNRAPTNRILWIWRFSRKSSMVRTVYLLNPMNNYYLIHTNIGTII